MVDGVATVTVACWTGQRFVIGNVGDSRAYLVRGRELKLLNSPASYSWGGDDDSHVERLDRGGDSSGTELCTLLPRIGHRLLLCTDGLWRVCTNLEIAAALDPRRACAALRDLVAGRAAEEASALVVAVEKTD